MRDTDGIYAGLKVANLHEEAGALRVLEQTYATG
jgi:hypothetical protein